VEKVVDDGMERMVENDERLRMVQDEWMERLDDTGWH
jgi:hypothetical protein